MGAGTEPTPKGERHAEEEHRAVPTDRWRQKPPTVRQVYALASAFCAAAGERFPRTRDEASALIEKLRLATNHPRPALEDNPLRGPMRPRFDWRTAAAKSRRR